MKVILLISEIVHISPENMQELHPLNSFLHLLTYKLILMYLLYIQLTQKRISLIARKHGMSYGKTVVIALARPRLVSLTPHFHKLFGHNFFDNIHLQSEL